jgi:hypothetical protein
MRSATESIARLLCWMILTLWTNIGRRFIAMGAATTYFADCTYSGAEFLAKKSLSSAQNLENKGSDFFLPCRSMVLKVVTGKIF